MCTEVAIVRTKVVLLWLWMSESTYLYVESKSFLDFLLPKYWITPSTNKYLLNSQIDLPRVWLPGCWHALTRTVILGLALSLLYLVRFEMLRTTGLFLLALCILNFCFFFIKEIKTIPDMVKNDHVLLYSWNYSSQVE